MTLTLTIGIDHIGLTARHLEATRDFFVECLGWKVVGEKPDYPAVFVSDGSALLTLWQAKEEPPTAFDRRKNVGLHHIALRAANEAAFNEILERVSTWPGVIVEFPPELLGTGPKRHMMIHEPGGIRVEFDFDPRVQ
ncbi:MULTISPECIES: VOC family protein [unclassified Caballeronia]|uniref:VOC family protein n=1 Tax=unclassified Caballeronia TaxID=2646786 RepID=UPI00285A2A39|nr:MULTISPECIES: VOC family protein [unclassified Caballeronia]MDR5817951.1 VOC family protein [Caballeronia sp. LZ033]MDR5824911.1 VOC family protein [Caballeronia sp. LZ043]MDR5882791.1 VOC family protein [Caballeronia sp. LZ032]